MLKLEHVSDLSIRVGQPIAAGETLLGTRRIVPILGGYVSGTKLNGRILNAGADHQILRTDGVTELRARYVIETTGGTRIYIDNFGLRHGPKEAMERLRRGESVDPALIYFRSTPCFETTDNQFSWLTKNIFVATGARYPDRVELTVYQIL